MRFIKQAIIGIIGLSVVVTLFSLLLPSETHGRRGIVINAEPGMILTEINDFNNWKNWHPNFNSDSVPVKATITKNSCDIERSGKIDHYEIIASTDSSVIVLLQRKGENDIKHIFTLSKDAAGMGTYVDWKFISHLKWYPWEKFSGFFTESFTAPGMMLGLEKMKQHIEASK